MPTARWQKLDAPGTDTATLHQTPEGYQIEGQADFEEANRRYEVSYTVHLDTAFTAQSALLSWGGETLHIQRTREGDWLLNGVPQPQAAHTADLDLSFTPATNLATLRRLTFPLDEDVPVTIAYLLFPEKRLTALPQRYRRVGEGRYRYAAPTFTYEAELQVHPSGFIIHYPGLWQGMVEA